MRAAMLAMAVFLAGCEPDIAEENVILGGDSARGAALVAEMGCAACHVVPGVAGPRGMVGPSLEGFARRAMIGGVIANRPDNLVRWLLNPPAIAPETAMPNLGLDTAQARDIATYLYTLR